MDKKKPERNKIVDKQLNLIRWQKSALVKVLAIKMSLLYTAYVFAGLNK